LAYNFNDEGTQPGEATSLGAAGAASPEARQSSTGAPGEPGTSADAPQSPAFARFNSCRWQQPAENGNAAFCTHREVKPYAGTTGFDPDAWCGDCQYFKLRRAPKKRSPADEYSY
jgi:hypothetical protein